MPKQRPRLLLLGVELRSAESSDQDSAVAPDELSALRPTLSTALRPGCEEVPSGLGLDLFFFIFLHSPVHPWQGVEADLQDGQNICPFALRVLDGLLLSSSFTSIFYT